MENWFVLDGVMVKTGAVCDNAVKAVAIMTAALPKIPSNVSQCLLMVFIEFDSVVF